MCVCVLFPVAVVVFEYSETTTPLRLVIYGEVFVFLFLFFLDRSHDMLCEEGS